MTARQLLAKLPTVEFKPIKEDCIRRDPSFKTRQLYFWKKKETNDGKVLMNLSQTTADHFEDFATIRTFLERKLSRVSDFLITVAIDEVKRKLYILFGDANEALIRRINFLKLKIIPIDFGYSDHLGYRKITLKSPKNGTRTLFNFSGANDFGVVQLFLHPKTGTLMFQAAAQDRYDLQTQHKIGWSKIDPKSDVITPSFTESFNPGHREPVNRCLVRGDWLLISFKPLPHDAMLAIDQSGNVDPDVDDLLWDCTGGFALFHIKKTPKFTLTLSKIWFPELKPFLKLLVPTNRHFQSLATLAENKTSGELMKYLGQSSAHVGIVHKYHLFTFPLTDSTIIAVKRLESFLAGKSISNCRIVDLSDVILDCGLKHTPDVTKTVPCPDVKWVLGTKFMVQIAMYNTQTGKGPAVLYETEVGTVFKDYRICATCGKREENKKRSKRGKRTSSFKICRLCKKLNFHMEWRKYPCHYCSLECMKSDWIKHKQQHGLKAISRPAP